MGDWKKQLLLCEGKEPGSEREGEDNGEGKKTRWITFPYCMCRRIHHLVEPDVRHSHQTFQIKRPPHPSTPLHNPGSISLSRTIKPLSAFTHTHAGKLKHILKRTRAVHWNSLTFSSYFSKGSCWEGSFLMFLQQRHSLRMQNISELPDEALWVILSDVKRGGECYLHAALMLK